MLPIILSIVAKVQIVIFALLYEDHSIDRQTVAIIKINDIFNGKFILTNIFSKDRLASQQFRKTGINKFRSGGHSIYIRVIDNRALL